MKNFCPSLQNESNRRKKNTHIIVQLGVLKSFKHYQSVAFLAMELQEKLVLRFLDIQHIKSLKTIYRKIAKLFKDCDAT